MVFDQDELNYEILNYVHFYKVFHTFHIYMVSHLNDIFDVLIDEKNCKIYNERKVNKNH